MVTQSMPEFTSIWARPTPPPGSRIKPEGVPNYVRNRGTIDKVAFERDTPRVETPRPQPRCPTSASRANHKLGWHGNVAPLMDGTATPRPSTAPPRIKPEGEAIASVSRGKRMRVIVHEFGQHGPSPRKPRVKVEAKATADVAKGGRMYSLLHKYGTMPLSARAVPRVKPEAEGIATVSKGKRMENLIHKYGRNEVTPRMPPRVKPEANDNAQLDRGFRMATLVHSFQLPVSARRVPRVKPEAAASAQLDQGFRMSKLLHESHTLPSTPRPVPRAIGQQAQGNLWRGVMGSVGKCLRQSGRKSFIFTPGEQSRAFYRARTM